jgi:hypothetical protein
VKGNTKPWHAAGHPISISTVRDQPSILTAPAKEPSGLLLDMLLDGGDFTTIYKILAAYPYLQAEYTDRVMQAERASKEREKPLA